jgi:ABC-type anion transport system duplicated permease subunit
MVFVVRRETLMLVMMEILLLVLMLVFMCMGCALTVFRIPVLLDLEIASMDAIFLAVVLLIL